MEGIRGTMCALDCKLEYLLHIHSHLLRYPGCRVEITRSSFSLDQSGSEPLRRLESGTVESERTSHMLIAIIKFRSLEGNSAEKCSDIYLAARYLHHMCHCDTTLPLNVVSVVLVFVTASLRGDLITSVNLIYYRSFIKVCY